MPLTPRQQFLVRGTLVVLAGLGVVAGLLVLGVFPPTATAWYPKCTLYTQTGLHCPGCGLTRATHAALNGRIGEAVSQNVLVFVIVPWLLLFVVRGLWHYLWQIPLDRRRPTLRWPAWLSYTVLVLLLTFSVARNIPVYPFTLLAPHELTTAAVPTDEPAAGESE